MEAESELCQCATAARNNDRALRAVHAICSELRSQCWRSRGITRKERQSIASLWYSM